MLELSCLLLSSADKSTDTDRNQSTDEENKGPEATDGRFPTHVIPSGSVQQNSEKRL